MILLPCATKGERERRREGGRKRGGVGERGMGEERDR